MIACTQPHQLPDLIVDGPVKMTRDRWDALVRCVHGVVICEVTGGSYEKTDGLARGAVIETLIIQGGGTS